MLEDSGLTVKRFSTDEQAIEKARQLQITGQLKAIIFGGGEQGGKKLDAQKAIAELRDENSLHARLHGLMPLNRIGIYSVHQPLSETLRLESWKTGIKVIDDAEDFEAWIDDRPPWVEPVDEDEEEEDQMDRAQSYRHPS